MRSSGCSDGILMVFEAVFAQVQSEANKAGKQHQRRRVPSNAEKPGRTRPQGKAVETRNILDHYVPRLCETESNMLTQKVSEAKSTTGNMATMLLVILITRRPSFGH